MGRLFRAAAQLRQNNSDNPKQDRNNKNDPQKHTILKIEIIKALNESVGRLLGPPQSTDKTTLDLIIQNKTEITQMNH